MMGQKQVKQVNPTAPTPSNQVTNGQLGDPESSVLVTPRYSAQYMQLINDCLQQLLAFTGRPKETSVSRLFRMVTKHITPQTYEQEQDILIKVPLKDIMYEITEDLHQKLVVQNPQSPCDPVPCKIQKTVHKTRLSMLKRYSTIVRWAFEKLKFRRWKMYPAAIASDNGDQCSGIYFIMEGTVAVVTENGENIITTLTSGQFFGEVSTIYKIPVTARVRAESRCQCFVIEESHVWNLLPNSRKCVDIIDWFVARKYIPTSNSLDCQRVYRRMLLYSFQELPLFQGWSDMSLKDLIISLSAESVILYPPNCFIVCDGDPGHFIHILLRGRAVISGKSGVQVETTGIKYPIVIGEAGMFLEKPNILNVKTLSECQVVSVKLENILTSVEEEANDCRAAWDMRKELWEEYAQREIVHVDDVTEDETSGPPSEDFLQFEVIFQHLSNSSLFNNSTLPLLDYIVRVSSILHIPDGQLAYNEQDSKDRTVLLVLKGVLELVETSRPSTSTQDDIQTVTQGQIIAKVPGMPTKVTYRSVGESYIIKYTTSFLKQSLMKFSPKDKYVSHTSPRNRNESNFSPRNRNETSLSPSNKEPTWMTL